MMLPRTAEVNWKVPANPSYIILTSVSYAEA
jgi:hypothetical protein